MDVNRAEEEAKLGIFLTRAQRFIEVRVGPRRRISLPDFAALFLLCDGPHIVGKLTNWHEDTEGQAGSEGAEAKALVRYASQSSPCSPPRPRQSWGRYMSWEAWRQGGWHWLLPSILLLIVLHLFKDVRV